MPTNALILGIPGAGKTTVGKKLADCRDANYLSASAVLQAYAQANDHIGKRWKRYWLRGEMAPDSEVLPVLWQHYDRAVQCGSIVLDGYPRTLTQLDDFWSRGGRINITILLEPSEDIACRRLLERKQVEQRYDDELNVIRNRIERARIHLRALRNDPRIQGSLYVVACSDLDRADTLNEVTSVYDSHVTLDPRQPTSDACSKYEDFYERRNNRQDRN